MEILPKNRPSATLFNRRGFLTGVGATLLQGALIQPALARFASAPKLGGYPFTLGVASGDPLPHGIVLWTRLAPDPLRGGGMPHHAITVEWQIATDERMKKIVQRGATLAVPQLGHSVHVEVHGLKPSRWYWYRFTVGNEESPIGRTRTAPRRGAHVDNLRFAFVSCQQFAEGYFPALRRLSEEDLDFAIHLGDYIYEDTPRPDIIVRTHLPDVAEIFTIEDYRIRHAQYKSDPAVQAVHAAFPWLVTWDDHELENDWAGFLPQDPADQPIFAERRASAFQAYYEHMPLRAAQLPNGPFLQLYRRLAFGDLMQVNVLDTRQYRSHGAPSNCALTERIDGYCPSALDVTRTILGEQQRDWLIDGLGHSTASWNLLANQVNFAPVDSNPDPAIRTLGGEKWDGYPFDRQELLNFIADRKLWNTIVITGDTHLNVVRNVPPDYINLDAEPIATEFVGTSISTEGDRAPSTVFGDNGANGPHRRFLDNHHGYVRCVLTPQLWRSDYRVVPTVLTQEAPISTLASFVVEQGRAGAQLA